MDNQLITFNQTKQSIRDNFFALNSPKESFTNQIYRHVNLSTSSVK